jgi:26S proteasome regulatory subunit N9
MGIHRLWHQLTLKLLDFVDQPAAQAYRLDVFENFVRDFEARVNQLRLVELGVKVARDIDSAYSLNFSPSFTI